MREMRVGSRTHKASEALRGLGVVSSLGIGTFIGCE